MSGLNSLSGLNNVNVDFRPTVELIKPKTGDANQPQPGADAVPVAAPQPERPRRRQRETIKRTIVPMHMKALRCKTLSDRVQ